MANNFLFISNNVLSTYQSGSFSNTTDLNIKGDLTISGNLNPLSNFTILNNPPIITPAEVVDYVRVYVNNYATVSSSGDFLVPFDTVVYQKGTSYNISTRKYTPTVAGYYLLTSNVTLVSDWQGSPPTAYFGVSIIKNGVTYSRNEKWYEAYNRNVSVNIQDIVYLNGTTDYIEIYGSVLIALTGIIQSGEFNTNFTGFLIGK